MTKLMTTLTISAIASILIIGGFASATPNAFSTYGDDHDDDHDDDHNSPPQIPVGLCSDASNLVENGCFENPIVSNQQGWNLYEGQSLDEVSEFDSISGWDVAWVEETNPCLEGEPGFDSVGLLELHRNILGGSSEGEQHAELDSDCNGPINNDRSKEDAGVVISQNIATSSNEEYEVTFAYKARPEVKLKTNDLMVTWNDEDITPDLKFSKKKWKYAITIPVSGIDGLSKLSFIDTGKSDSLGTFLDDVSVLKVEQEPEPPQEGAPTVKITVQVNNLEGVEAEQFEYTVGTETMVKNGDVISIPINTPTMFNQTNFIDRNDPNNLELPSSIEGDGNCPDVIGTNGDEIGFLTLSANQNIECVIVYGKAIEPGVVFHFDSLRFDTNTIFNDPLDPNDPPIPSYLDKCDSMESVKPCMFEDSNSNEFNLVPNISESQLRVTALIQFNVIAIAANNAMIDLDGETSCEFVDIGRSPKMNPAFIFTCDELNSEAGQFRVNYALIETLQAGKSLT